MAFLYRFGNAVVIIALLTMEHFSAIEPSAANSNFSGRCIAPTVNTGDTAVMTFFFSKDINTSSDAIFVYLRRAAAPRKDILHCDRNSPLNCTSINKQYSTDFIKINNSVTVLIPNVTKEFQDEYILHVNVNKTTKPSIVCYLKVQDVDNVDCPTGKWKCSNNQCIFARWRCDGREDCEDRSDEANCDNVDCPIGKWKCSNNHCIFARWRCDGREDCENKIDEENCDNVDCPNGKWKCSNNHCIFARWRCDGREDCEDRSDEANCGETDTKEGHTLTILIAVVVLVLIIVTIGFCFVVICYLRKRQKSGHADESEMTLLSINTDSTVNNYKDKRWYWPEANEEGDKLLVNNFWKNGPGAFLVRPSKTNTANFVLVASFDGTVQHLTLVPTEEGVMCPSTGGSFKTLCQVVKYYRQNTITVAGRPWGKLSKPFARAPEEDWYYGRLVTEYEENVLLSSRCRNGSFLIADAFTDADAYYLIVRLEGRIHRFGIAPNDDVFRMVDADLSRKTLAGIVDYYTHNEIITSAGRNFGKLYKACPKEPDVQWFSETLTFDEETKILQSRRKRPGSFLVSKGVTNPNKYVLAVYFGDELKRFTVNKEGNGFKLQNSERLFYSWYELVDYYREHDIEVRDNMFGKLSRPLRKEPEESCYIGRKTRMEERDLLLAKTAASGDFLIRDGITDPEAYVLAVNFNGHINHFDIYREKGGFRFDDTGKLCTTLGELVSFYKSTEIKVGELPFGKLVKEVGR